MESLKPSQLILLSILVTFVTTIATTIITISLLSDTPLSITQVVNRVVERERITDADIESIRDDILVQVEERLVQEPQPQVLGVETEAEVDFLELMANLPSWETRGIELDRGLMIVASTTKESHISVGEVFLQYETSPVFAFDVIESEEEIYGLSIAAKTVRPGVVESVASAAAGDEYTLQIMTTSVCENTGDWVTVRSGQVVGVCIEKNTALSGVSVHESQEQEQ